MTGLDEFIYDSENLQKQTYIKLSNPDHPKVRGDYADQEVMRGHYRAAKALKHSPVNHKLLLGDFLVAVEKELVQGEEGEKRTIDELLQALSEYPRPE